MYDSAGRLVLKSLTLPELEAWCAAQGEAAPANRALQLWRWMYADPPAGGWIQSLEETLGRQNGFSQKFIDKVGPQVTLDGGLSLSRVVRAADGTRKLVFTITTGEAAGGSVETVLIPVVRQKGLRDRLTICVSSQVGCAMNCQFCFTGRMGLLGNLSAAQIVEQVVAARRFLAAEGDRTPLTNLVFMGMGEPLANVGAVLAATHVVSHYLGLHISHNKITISTVGLVPELRAVVAASRVQVALSLHATTDEVRDWIVPVNRRYDLATLVAALEELFPQEEEAAAAAAAGSGVDETAAHGSDPSGLSALPSSSQCMAEEEGGREGSAVAAGRDRESRADVHGERWLPPLDTPSAAGTVPSTTASGSSSSSSSIASSASTHASHAASSDRAASASPAPSTSAPSTSTLVSAPASPSASPPPPSGRSLLVEYTMLHGINDTREDAERLATMLSRVQCKVNLIVFNPHDGTRFRPSTDGAVTAFRSALIQRGLVCTIRDSRGDDEMAACGQLGAVGLPFRPSPILQAPPRFEPFLLPPPATPPGLAAA